MGALTRPEEPDGTNKEARGLRVPHAPLGQNLPGGGSTTVPLQDASALYSRGAINVNEYDQGTAQLNTIRVSTQRILRLRALATLSVNLAPPPSRPCMHGTCDAFLGRRSVRKIQTKDATGMAVLTGMTNRKTTMMFPPSTLLHFSIDNAF